MDLLPTLFGIGCCATTAASVVDRRRLFIALILDGIWALSMLGWQWNALDIYPVMDCAFACLIFAMWFEVRARWLKALVYLAYAQLALHAFYQIEGVGVQTAYLLLLDVTFAAELFVVSWKGVANACAFGVRGVRALLSSYQRLHAAKAVSRV